MQTTILNTSILTAHWQFSYLPLTLNEALAHLQTCDETGVPVVSAVGHAATAEILTELLRRAVKMNRIEFRQEAGDCALVFKLRGRPPEGKVLSRDEVESIGYDFGLLTRTS